MYQIHTKKCSSSQIYGQQGLYLFKWINTISDLLIGLADDVSN